MAGDVLIRIVQFILFANVFGIVGYIILLTVSTDGVRYFATFLCAVAVYNGPGLNVTWINVNVAPHYRRATTIGFQQTSKYSLEPTIVFQSSPLLDRRISVLTTRSVANTAGIVSHATARCGNGWLSGLSARFRYLVPFCETILIHLPRNRSLVRSTENLHTSWVTASRSERCACLKF